MKLSLQRKSTQTRGEKKKALSKKLTLTAQLFALSVIGLLCVSAYYSQKELHGRSLAGSASCSGTDLNVGTFIVWILLTLYLFLGLAIVCDEYFQISLEIISDVLKLTPDVAGATFLAAGSSAPELFTSIGDTFGSQNSIGLGTIVGSAMFNILIIVAGSAFVAGRDGGVLHIDWRPICRDVCFYSFSVVTLVMFFNDSVIQWYEGLIMVLMYFVYVTFMYFNSTIFAMCPTPEEQEENRDITPEEKKAIEMVEKMVENTESNELSLHVTSETLGADVTAKVEEGQNIENKDEEDDEDEVDMPFLEALKEKLSMPEDESTMGKALHVVSVPFLVAFHCTIPDASNVRFKKFYVLSFIMSILWIALLCHYMVVLATDCACFLEIDPVIMGILVLAVGTSVPDAIGSMIAAKNGEADMAIANAIGSNVFDILLGLGLPWFFVAIIKEPMTVMKCGVLENVLILIGTVFVFLFILIANKWKMNTRVGGLLLFAYIVYVIYIIIKENQKWGSCDA